MSRINTNIPSMVAARVLQMQNKGLNDSLNKLSTGLRINSGRDDPAGLIASEALRAEKVAINGALTNISRANNIIATAEGGLDEVNKLLTELEDLVDRSANEAGISDDERAANQLQIDSILESINRIANSTEFQGKKLLNGDLTYTTSNVSGNANIDKVVINSARISNGSYRDVIVDVTQSAQTGALSFSGSTVGTSAVTLEVAGNLGTETLSFAGSTNISAVAFAINQSTDITGVTANASGSSLTFNSDGYGSDQFVSVRTLNGTFNVTGGDAGDNTDYGRDATVLVNGTKATTDGLRASIRNSSLSLDIDLDQTLGAATGSTTFQITGGGADFMITPTVSLAGLASLGIDSLTTGSLGNATDGSLASLASGQTNALSNNNYSAAQRIVRAAQTQVSVLRGRLGAFQKDTLDTMSNSLRITLENTTAAESSIRDTDFATETSELTRRQILSQSAMNVLRQANAQPQQVLQLLG